MAVTRINNNQISDASAGNVYVGINASTKIQPYSVTATKLANNLTYGSDLTVTGNLTVQGNTTTIDTTYTTIEDPILLLASNQTGAPAIDIGFVGQRGTSQNIAFVWDESAEQFVTAYTTTGESNTVISIASYADLHVGNANIGGNIVINGTTSLVGSVIGNVSLAGNITLGNVLTSGQVSAAGNVTGGNVNTGGLVSASGNIISAANISGGNLLATTSVSAASHIGSVVSVSANITGGNLLTGGLISSTGNITSAANVSGGNLISSALVQGVTLSASGNITGGNILTDGQVSASGNITSSANISGGNLLTSGIVSAASHIGSVVSVSANITGGNLLTGGLISSTGNITSAANVSGANVIASGNVSAVGGYFTGNVTVLGNLLTVGGNILYANSGVFYGTEPTGNGAIYAGITNYTPLGSNVVAQFAGNSNSYSQINFQNISNLSSASTDYIATADNGSDTTNYLDLGINSSNFNDQVNYPGFGPLDSYVHNHGGNLILNPESSGKIIKFMIGGTANADVVANVTSTGITSGGTFSAAGNITSASNIAGGNLLATTTVSAASHIGTTASLSGNITGGNLLTGGLISSTGNITSAANVAGGNLVATTAVATPTVIGTTVTISSTGGLINLAPTSNVSTSNKNINNLADPIQDQDAATKAYVDNMVSTQLAYHAGVVAATTTTLEISTGGTITYAQPNGAGNGVGATLTVAGGTFNLIDTANIQTANTRVLVKNQANAALNGVYQWSNATVLVRTSDADSYGPSSADHFSINDYFFVSSGNINAGSAWVVDGPSGTITFGTSNITFAQFSSSQTYTANTSAGILLTGTVISAQVDNNTTAFDIGGNIIVKASANLTTPNIGAATGTSLSVTGNLTSAGANISGNVSGGNLLTGGLISSTGDITSAANITGGNILTGGLVSSAGNITSSSNITGGNLLATTTISAASVLGSIVSASANITGGNLLTGGLISSTGNISSVGNISASYFLGNGRQLTGINSDTSGFPTVAGTSNIAAAINGNIGITIASTSNVVTFASTGEYVTGVVSASGNITSAANIASGNILASANVVSVGAVVSGNITGGNLVTAGLTDTGTLSVSSTSTFTGNITSAFNVTGNITSGNLITAGNVYAPAIINNGVYNTKIELGSASGIIAVTTDGNSTQFGPSGTITLGGASQIQGGTFGGSGITVAGTQTDIFQNRGGNVTVQVGTGGTTTSTWTFTNSGNLLAPGNISATGNVTGTNVIGTTSVTGGNIVISGDNITDTNGRVNVNTAGDDVDFAVNGTAANIFYINGTSNTASFGNSTQITNAIVSFNSNRSIVIPTGTTSDRPDVGVTGMFRFNTTLDAVEIFDTDSWTTVGTPNFTIVSDQQFNGDGANAAFTLTTSTTTNSTIVSINGILQIPTIAYSVGGAGANILTFTEAPQTGDIIDVRNLTTTTQITSISNSPGNAIIQPNATSAIVEITGDLNPVSNVIYSLGNTTNRWKDLWLSGSSLNIGNIVMKNTSGNTVAFYGADGTTPATIDSTNVDTTTITNGTSNVSVATSGGNVRFNVGSTSNVMVVSSTTVAITGDLSVTGNATLTGNILGDRIVNGTTELAIQVANGNANLTIGGTSNVVVWASDGEYITGTLNVSGNIRSTAGNGVANIGSAANYFNTVHAKATSAQYADLAENYAADAEYAPGTVLSFGGVNEVTVSTVNGDRRIAGVVSTNPSYIMNSMIEAEYVATLALTGRVPTFVSGPVEKGDMMVSAGNGRAIACATPAIGTVIGKALENHNGGDGIIEVVVGRL